MAFKNHEEDQTLYDLESEKARARADIAALGLKMDEAIAENDRLLKEAGLCDIELSRVKSEIDKHDRELSEKEKQLSDIEVRIISAKDILSGHEELVKADDDQKKIIENDNATIEALKQDIVSLEKKRDVIVESTTALVEKRDDIEKAYISLSQKADKLSDEFKKQVIEYNIIINELKENMESLKGDAAKHLTESNEHKEIVKKLKEDIQSLHREFEDTAVRIKRDKEESEKYHTDIKMKHDAREKELQDREGAVSLKESWIRQKAQQLAAMKVEIESFHGKKIPINVPVIE